MPAITTRYNFAAYCPPRSLTVIAIRPQRAGTLDDNEGHGIRTVTATPALLTHRETFRPMR